MTITDRCPLEECTLWDIDQTCGPIQQDDAETGDWRLFRGSGHTLQDYPVHFCPFCGIPLITEGRPAPWQKEVAAPE